MADQSELLSAVSFKETANFPHRPLTHIQDAFSFRNPKRFQLIHPLRNILGIFFHDFLVGKTLPPSEIHLAKLAEAPRVEDRAAAQ